MMATGTIYRSYSEGNGLLLLVFFVVYFGGGVFALVLILYLVICLRGIENTASVGSSYERDYNLVTYSWFDRVMNAILFPWLIVLCALWFVHILVYALFC